MGSVVLDSVALGRVALFGFVELGCVGVVWV